MDTRLPSCSVQNLRVIRCDADALLARADPDAISAKAAADADAGADEPGVPATSRCGTAFVFATMFVCDAAPRSCVDVCVCVCVCESGTKGRTGFQKTSACAKGIEINSVATHKSATAPLVASTATRVIIMLPFLVSSCEVSHNCIWS